MQVNINEKVYIVGRGYGIVKQIDSKGNFVVATAKRGMINVNSKGEVGGIRCAYYQDPFIMEPPRNSRFWNDFVKLTRTFYSLLRTYGVYGKDVDEPTEEE